MKVALVKPCWDYPKGRAESTYNRIWTPLDLATSAAILRNSGHEVMLIDAQALDLSPSALASRIGPPAGGSSVTVGAPLAAPETPSCATGATVGATHASPDTGIRLSADSPTVPPSFRSHVPTFPRSHVGSFPTQAFSPDLVLLTSTGLDRFQCPYNDATPFVEAARALKAAGHRVVAYGFHGTVNPAAVLRATGVDAVIRGEPEGAVADIAAGKDVTSIEGVSYLRDGAVVSNPDRAPIDITTLPVPAVDLFDLKRYFYEVLGGDYLLLETTRGCPYHCTFCSKVMYGKVFRRKTAAQVRAEIDYALDHTSVKTIYFIDLEFTVARDLAVAVCEHLISRGSPVRWTCQTRADNVDAELLSLMKRAGCELIHLGVESGSARILAESGKSTTKDDILRGARLIRAAGIETLAFFMFGLPGESYEDRMETINFAIALDPTYASFHFATPYPGSDLFDTLGLTLHDDLSFLLVPPAENIEDLKRWVSKAIRAFYLRPSYIFRHVIKGGPRMWGKQLRLFVSYLK